MHAKYVSIGRLHFLSCLHSQSLFLVTLEIGHLV